MPLTRRMMSIHDDTTGEGVQLAFPTMSTCSACICVLANRLVGVHKTQGWRASTATLFQHAMGLVNNDRIYELYIVGWNVGNQNAHDVARIRTALGCTAVPTFVYDFNNTTVPIGNTQRTQQAFTAGFLFHAAPTTDLCTFAMHKGKRDPTIGIKRSSKATATRATTAEWAQHTRNHGGGATARFFALDEDITTSSDHLHKLGKFLEFRRV